MQQVGYNLVDANGTVLQSWGDTLGQIEIPDKIVLPSGDIVHCPSVDADYQGLRLVPRMKTLDTVKASLVDQVQSEFEDACAKIITPGSAMASVYRVQVDAAYRLIAGAITTHPSLASLVGILGSTETEVATIIKTRNEQCEAAMSALNAKRLTAKNAIAAAPDEASARAAAVVTWGI